LESEPARNKKTSHQDKVENWLLYRISYKNIAPIKNPLTIKGHHRGESTAHRNKNKNKTWANVDFLFIFGKLFTFLHFTVSKKLTWVNWFWERGG
jgi:hypothetical protein